MFCNKDVLKSFANFIAKHLCQSLLLIKLQDSATGGCFCLLLPHTISIKFISVTFEEFWKKATILGFISQILRLSLLFILHLHCILHFITYMVPHGLKSDESLKMEHKVSSRLPWAFIKVSSRLPWAFINISEYFFRV